jgi:hypothetical protein
MIIASLYIVYTMRTCTVQCGSATFGLVQYTEFKKIYAEVREIIHMYEVPILRKIHITYFLTIAAYQPKAPFLLFKRR